jgi:replicative superfamily II helicase
MTPGSVDDVIGRVLGCMEETVDGPHECIESNHIIEDLLYHQILSLIAGGEIRDADELIRIARRALEADEEKHQANGRWWS